MLEVGMVLEERYRLDALLGEGGMGRVFRAYDISLRRSVALKALRPALVSSMDHGLEGGRAQARLLREARAVAALAHPNIVSIHDVRECDGTAYIIMELAEGTLLRDLIGAPQVTVAEKLRWLVAVARALAAAHERGIVHRDIKPENVIVGHDGAVKVLDFGVAMWTGEADSRVPTADAPASRLTAEGRIVGTPRFMSPEQIEGRTLDARSDQFSWGVLAYELLSGKSPWATIDPSGGNNLFDLIRRKHPARLGAVALGVPGGVEGIVWKTLAKDPDQRFSSMAELADALEQELDGLAVAATSRVPMTESVEVEDRPAATRAESPQARAPSALLPGVVSGATPPALTVGRDPSEPTPWTGGSARTLASIVPRSEARRRSLRRAGAGIVALIALGALTMGGLWLWDRSKEGPVAAGPVPNAFGPGDMPVCPPGYTRNPLVGCRGDAVATLAFSGSGKAEGEFEAPGAELEAWADTAGSWIENSQRPRFPAHYEIDLAEGATPIGHLSCDSRKSSASVCTTRYSDRDRHHGECELKLSCAVPPVHAGKIRVHAVATAGENVVDVQRMSLVLRRK